MTSVMFVGEQESNALVYYRQVIPGSALERLGYEVRFAPALAERPDGLLTGIRPGFRAAPVPEVIVTRHITDPTRAVDSADLIMSARRMGQRVFYDLDDNLWELPEHNPAFVYYTPEMLEVLNTNLAACDGVLTSTPTLAQVIAQHTDTPVTVAPNGILVDNWPMRYRHRQQIRVGWLGLMDFRADDLTMIVGGLAAALAGEKNVEFVHCGAHNAKGSIRKLLGDWPVPVDEVGWCAFHDLGGQLAGNLDAAVVPMRPGPLNDSRSPTTGLALAACGIPFVASSTPAYRDLAARVPGVRLVDDDNPDTWQHAVTALLDDVRSGRGPYGQAMRSAVKLHYRPEVVVRAWIDALGTFRPLPARVRH